MRRPQFRPRFVAKDGRLVAPGPPERAAAAEFRAIVLPHLDAAYSLARYLLRDPVLAEDVTQDAFLRAHRSFAQFQGASAKAWLFAIVRNCCWTALDDRRRVDRFEVAASGEQTALAALADPAPGADDGLIRAEEAAMLQRTVMELPEPFREAIVLREMHECSYREIADITGVPVGTVMSRLARGRAMLSDLLLPAEGVAAGRAS